jgi:hypothetical protein
MSDETSRGGEQLTIAGFVEAVVGITVGSKDRDFVATILQADGGVDDEALGSANAQIRVEEDYVSRFGGHDVIALECIVRAHTYLGTCQRLKRAIPVRAWLPRPLDEGEG